MFGPFDTERLFIRPLKDEDVGYLYAYRSQEMVYKYQSWNHYTIADAKTLVRYQKIKPFDCRIGNTNIGVELKEEHRLIGDVFIGARLRKPKEVSIGYTFDPKYWHHGYAREAVEKVIEILHIDYHKTVFKAYVYPQNAASIRLLESLGFQKKFYDSLYGDVEYELLREPIE